jgi:hypothetical protein
MVPCAMSTLQQKASFTVELLSAHFRSGFFQSPDSEEPISYSYIPVVEMATNSNVTDSDVATPAADSSTKQRSVPKRRTFKRMIYGFAFSTDDLEERGRQRFGDSDDEKVLLGYISKSVSPLFDGCYRLWRRTSMHFVTYDKGPRRHESDLCLTFADNISPDTATPPPREIIDRMKEDLRIEKEPQWYRFYGD